MRLASIAIAALSLGLTAAAAPAAPVQWKVADGGNGHFYEVITSNTRVTWFLAQADAVARGGYLATLTSPEENQFVYSYANTVPGAWNFNRGPWLGGYQPTPGLAPDEGWTWVTGETWDYTNWKDGEPNDWFGTPEDYLQFWNRTPEWNDNVNDDFFTRSYIVEIIPEPGVAALLTFAGAAVAFRRRRSLD